MAQLPAPRFHARPCISLRLPLKPTSRYRAFNPLPRAPSSPATTPVESRTPFCPINRPCSIFRHGPTFATSTLFPPNLRTILQTFLPGFSLLLLLLLRLGRRFFFAKKFTLSTREHLLVTHLRGSWVSPFFYDGGICWVGEKEMHYVIKYKFNVILMQPGVSR